jgi:hypothetical protein
LRVITRNPSAEFGRTGGGVVLMTSKSGTNEFHGSVFEFLRNNVMNANNFFANRAGSPLPSSKLNQWGATLGGPVRRERTFFFGNYEGFEFRQAVETTRTVPTEPQRAGVFQGTVDAQGRQLTIFDPLTTQPAGTAFTRTAFPANTIPASRLSPVAVGLTRFIPFCRFEA